MLDVQQTIKFELSTKLYEGEVDDDEMIDFIDYLLAANCEKVPFYLAHETVAPITFPTPQVPA